jgi:hypothetical protein
MLFGLTLDECNIVCLDLSSNIFCISGWFDPMTDKISMSDQTNFENNNKLSLIQKTND